MGLGIQIDLSTYTSYLACNRYCRCLYSRLLLLLLLWRQQRHYRLWVSCNGKKLRDETASYGDRIGGDGETVLADAARDDGDGDAASIRPAAVGTDRWRDDAFVIAILLTDGYC